MVNALWIGGIVTVLTIASYIHVYLGIAGIAVSVMVAFSIWGLSAGAPQVWFVLVIPAIIGFCLGHFLRRRKESN